MSTDLQMELFDDSGVRVTQEDVVDLVKRGVQGAREVWQGVYNGIEAVKRYVITDLPTQWGYRLKRVGDYTSRVLAPVGKVFGAYDPNTLTVYIDRAVAYVNNPIRKLLEKYGLMMDPEEVIRHEISHGMQNANGSLSIYRSREMKEGLNQLMTERFSSKIGRWVTNLIRPYQLETLVAEKLAKMYGLSSIMNPRNEQDAKMYERHFHQIYESLHQQRNIASVLGSFRKLVPNYAPVRR